MNIKAVKKKIIDTVTNTDNEELLERIALLIKNESKNYSTKNVPAGLKEPNETIAYKKSKDTEESRHFWASLSTEQRAQLEADIEEAERDIKAGNVIPHEEAIKMLKRWPTK